MKIDYLEKIEQCILYIESNLRSPISINEVLEKTYYSYPHLHRIFQAIVGESITSYIRKRRLSSAAEDLITSNRTITEIAMNYEYNSQQTFNRAFTAYFEISPNKYREIGRLDNLYQPFIAKKIRQCEPILMSVNLEELPPMTVASYHSMSNNITTRNTSREQDKTISKAWGYLVRWQMEYEYHKQYGINKKLPSTLKLATYMIDNRLHLPPNTRYFGFNHPFPSREGEFGYETWVMLTNLSEPVIGATLKSDIEIKKYQGGRYASLEATYGADSNLDEGWKVLHQWMTQQDQYEYGDHQWFEEHITKEGQGGFHGFKLYMPIKLI